MTEYNHDELAHTLAQHLKDESARKMEIAEQLIQAKRGLDNQFNRIVTDLAPSLEPQA